MARHLVAIIILVVPFACVAAQSSVTRGPDTASTTQSTEADNTATSKPDAEQETVTTWMHLVGGRRTQVDDVTEASDGFWYRRGNLTTFIDRTRVERIERSSDPRLVSLSETFDGKGRWNISDSPRVKNFFMAKFNRPLPLSAFGQSELHNRWGLDHRQSMDVGLHPDSVEGKALIRFLVSQGIPFLAFRSSIPGVATGPHIHIGHGSSRLRKVK